jgi:CubicO group peptidase (beta-lactamase class C family)
VLARINEVQSGIRQEDYLIDNLYLPLGMTETFYRVPEALQPRIAPTGLGAPAADVHDPLARYHGTAAHCPGNAGLFSTAPDLARFCAWVLRDGEPLLRPGLLRSTTGNASPPGVGNRRGLGWDIFDDPPYTTPEHHASRTPVIGHTGYTGTMIWIDTRSGHYFVLLTNRVFPSDSPESSKGIIALRKAVAKATLALGEVRDEEASR